MIRKEREMGKAIVPESAFPEIIEIYNQNGRTAAYDCLRSRYGIRSPYFVVDRIKRCGRYHYESDTDRFIPTGASTADDVFINLDDLCSTAVVKTKAVQEAVVESRPEAMEKLVHELISDRLLTLSQYITLDSSTRTILIDQTSLAADGYRVVTH